MSKIIKIDTCGDCGKHDWIDVSKQDKIFCTVLSEKHIDKPELCDILDPSKILPNCPLEDYPEVKDAK